MATRNIVPRATEEGGIGTTLKRWLSGYFVNITADSATLKNVIVSDGDGAYLKLPVLTGTQRDALVVDDVLIIYNSTTAQIEKCIDGEWSALSTAGMDPIIASMLF